VSGPVPGQRTEPNQQDLDEIARVVRSAATLSDLVVVSLHYHEGGVNRSVPADFIPMFARAMIDAGADVFVGHGPHVLRGVEIYKGKPILYSLANFIFQNETLLRMPADSYEEYSLGDAAQAADYLDARYDKDRRSFPAEREYWDSVVATTKWEGRKLVELQLHPIHLGLPDLTRRSRTSPARCGRRRGTNPGNDDDTLEGVWRDRGGARRCRNRHAAVGLVGVLPAERLNPEVVHHLEVFLV